MAQSQSRSLRMEDPLLINSGCSGTNIKFITGNSRKAVEVKKVMSKEEMKPEVQEEVSLSLVT